MHQLQVSSSCRKDNCTPVPGMVVNYISVQDEDNWDVISQICYGSGGTTEYLLDDGSNPNAIKFGDNGAEERQLRLFNLLLGAG